MTPNEIERLRSQLCRVIPSYAEWLGTRIETIAALTGNSPRAELTAMLDEWDQVLAPVEFRSARVVVGMLRVGRLRCPYYGDLLRFIRGEASTVSARRRKSDRLQAERDERRQEHAEVVAAGGPNLLERVQAELRARSAAQDVGPGPPSASHLNDGKHSKAPDERN